MLCPLLSLNLRQVVYMSVICPDPVNYSAYSPTCSRPSSLVGVSLRKAWLSPMRATQMVMELSAGRLVALSHTLSHTHILHASGPNIHAFSLTNGVCVPLCVCMCVYVSKLQKRYCTSHARFFLMKTEQVGPLSHLHACTISFSF